MATLKHKTFGEGKIIHREGNIITVRFDRDGSERRFSIPDSFMFGHFEPDEELKNEVDAAIEAKKEADRLKREAREAQRTQIQSQSAVVASALGTKRTAKTPAKIKIKGAIEQDFEIFLVNSGYSEKTPTGAPSTVNAYIKAVESVLEEEHLNWQSLVTQISKVVVLYDIGGAKVDIGCKSNKTYINALRRFKDFVENSINITA